MKITTWRILLFSISITVFSCQQEEVFEPDIDIPSTFGIRHDKSLSDYEAIAASNSSDLPNFSSVVFFSYSLDGSDNQDYIASGTLIAPEWILTAGHNFYDAVEQNNPAPVSGIKVIVGNNPNNPDQIYHVDQIVLHPTWLKGDQDYEDANDLCLVKLSVPIGDLSPIPIHSAGTEQLGDKIWFCGFGDYSSIQGQNPNLDSKKHAVENILDRIQNGFQTLDGSTAYNGGLLAFDFDDPLGELNSLGDNVVNEDESILGGGDSAPGALAFEAGTVEGDSGGPLFVKNGNSWEVAGVLSGGADQPIANHQDGDYGDISIFIRVADAYNWIQSVIQ